MRRWIANHPPVSLFKKIAALHEALMKVAREYQDIGEAQKQGGYIDYACGIWIGGLKRGHAKAVKAAIVDKYGGDPDAFRGPGWWDAVPPKRATYFFAMTTEATTPLRAQLRCGEWLNNLLEEGGELDKLVESVRIEVEPMSTWEADE